MSMMADQLATPKRERLVKNPLPWYTPRFWHGMRLSTWMGELARNRFTLSVTKLHTATSITFVSGLNSGLALLDQLLYSKKTQEVELVQPPIFILGHWRSGTTFLHELMIRDPAHTYPNTYQCFVPHHFVFSERWLAPLTSKLIPSRRPMDNMAAGWQRPQEDEFALGNLGVPTPYLSMIFPNRGPVYPEYLDLRNLPEPERQRWCDQLLSFFQRISYRDPRRIVVKSPPHTARVRTLVKMFPQAKFVHLARDPYDVFVSTMGLWRSLNEVQRMSASDETWVEEYVLDSLERMYRAYDADRELLSSNQLFELTYEELVEEPLGKMRELYAKLELENFAQVEPALEKHLAEVKNYRTNHYELAEENRRLVHKRWATYFERYGYDR